MPSAQLRVAVVGTKPSVWRRIIVPTDVTAYEFHHMLQLSMGWKNHHLFEFKLAMSTLSLVDDWGNVTPLGEGKSIMENTTVTEMLKASGDSFTYLYDMGDRWLHRITIEEVMDKDVDHAICLEGEMACPPEDCGGIPGYEQMLKILKNKFNPERLNYMSWLDEYNPGWEKNRFDIDAANKELKDIRTWFKVPSLPAKKPGKKKA